MHTSTSLEIIYLKCQWFAAWLFLTLMPKISCILRVGIRKEKKNTYERIYEHGQSSPNKMWGTDHQHEEKRYELREQ